MTIRGVLVCCVVAALTACGGGGGSSSGGSTGGTTGGGSGSGGGSTTTYTIGGVVSGLSGTLVLQNNSGDDLQITSSNTFVFATPLATDAAYSVSVKTQPSGQTCTIANGAGTVSAADVANISVVCASSSVGSVISHRLALGAEKANLYYSGVRRDFALAVKADGSVIAWGNTVGGSGPAVAGTVNAHVVSGLVNIKSVVATWGHEISLALDSSGGVYAWGVDSGSGEVGAAASTSRTIDTPISITSVGTSIAAATGEAYFSVSNTQELVTFGVHADGSVWFNPNTANSATTEVTTTQIFGVSDVVDIVRGAGLSVLAIKSDGSVWEIAPAATSAGANTVNTSVSVAQVSGLSNIKQISCPYDEDCIALDNNGDVYTGFFRSANTSNYMKVQGVSGVKQAVATEACFLALTTSGQVYSWSPFNNVNYCLGLGSSVSAAATPTLISSLNNITEMAARFGDASGTSILVLAADGTVWGWGENAAGELGDGTTSIQYTPVQAIGINLN